METEHVIERRESASLAAELRKLSRAGRMVVSLRTTDAAWHVVTIEAPDAIETRDGGE